MANKIDQLDAAFCGVWSVYTVSYDLSKISKCIYQLPAISVLLGFLPDLVDELYAYGFQVPTGRHLSLFEVTVKIPRKYHSDEVQPSRGTKRRRDEEQIMAKQMLYMKTPTHKEELQ